MEDQKYFEESDWREITKANGNKLGKYKYNGKSKTYDFVSLQVTSMNAYGKQCGPSLTSFRELL